MANKSTVRITTVGEVEKTSKAGKLLQYVQITGYCHDTQKGFKKQFFATKQDGTATKMAESAYNFTKGDWVDITMDDSSFQNVTQIVAAEQPADFDESMTNSNSGGGGGGGYQKKSYNSGGGNKSDAMSKEEWAAKDDKKAASIARAVALNNAVVLAAASKKSVGTDVIIRVAREFELYLLDKSETTEPVTTGRPGTSGQDVPPTQTDSDIPF